VRAHGRGEAPQFVEQLLVDLESPGRIDDEGAVALAPRQFEGPARQADDVALAGLGVYGHAEALAQRLQLLDRGRAIDVRGHQSDAAALPLQSPRQLGRGGRFPGAVQPHEQDDRRWDRRDGQPLVPTAQQLDQLVVQQLHQLLTRGNRGQPRHAQRPLLQPAGQLAHHVEVDVRLQEDAPDLAHPFADDVLGEHASLTPGTQGALKPLAQLIEHRTVA
jgi:hypothetical protein